MQKETDNGRGYRQSRQRQRILQLLRSTDRHPTADWLYEQLKKEFPHLSLGTIYRNLTVLVKQGLVEKIHHGSTFDRFEAKADRHYHLICERCGAILDFEMPIYDELNEKAKRLTRFQVQYHRIEFYGICTKCARLTEAGG